MTGVQTCALPISMDFIEKLPMFNGSDTILVIIDCLTKQSIFIPTVNTIMSPMLAKLFVLHVFSKHGVPLHITSDHGTEFVSAFFHSLSKVLDMKLHFTLGYHPEGDGQTDVLIRLSNSTSESTATTSKATGLTCYL